MKRIRLTKYLDVALLIPVTVLYGSLSALGLLFFFPIVLIATLGSTSVPDLAEKNGLFMSWPMVLLSFVGCVGLWATWKAVLSSPTEIMQTGRRGRFVLWGLGLGLLLLLPSFLMDSVLLISKMGEDLENDLAEFGLPSLILLLWVVVALKHFFLLMKEIRRSRQEEEQQSS